MRVVVTGGAGYIGSHVVLSLLDAGHQVVVLDNLSSGLRSRVADGVPLVVGDVGDAAVVRPLLTDHAVDAVLHLAARKAVGESVQDPLLYYEQNVTAWRTLLAETVRAGVGTVVFASSAAVYGSAADGVVDETTVPQPESPYGRTKLVGEWLLEDTAAATGLRWAALRLFNVAGARNARVADTATDNLLPVLLGAVEGSGECSVYGDSHPTPDGTCVRDYVHVDDVAEAHVAALHAAAAGGLDDVVNVGTGRGVSVLEMVEAVRRLTGQPLRHRITPPRPGDPAAVVADGKHIAETLGWRAQRGLDEIVTSAWQARQR